MYIQSHVQIIAMYIHIPGINKQKSPCKRRGFNNHNQTKISLHNTYQDNGFNLDLLWLSILLYVFYLFSIPMCHLIFWKLKNIF